MTSAKWAVTGLVAAVVTCWGCDGGTSAPPVSTSTEEANVTGTVTVAGKPATNGTIQFDPANVERKVMPRTAPIGSDGSYTVKTLVGGNAVTVGTPPLKKGQSFNKVVEVKSGDNSVPIEVP